MGGVGGGGTGSSGLQLSVDDVVRLNAVSDEGEKGGGGHGPFSGLCLCCPWRRDGPHHVRVECGGGGEDGGSSSRAGGSGRGVGCGSVCRLIDGFWWREGEEARNG